jgi:hypothetical protein
VPFDEAGDGRVQGGDAGVDATPDLFVGEQREEPFDLIEL